jgi:hypothetical protein
MASFAWELAPIASDLEDVVAYHISISSLLDDTEDSKQASRLLARAVC